MHFRAYSYKLRREILLLTDAEWDQIAPLAARHHCEVMAHLKQTGCTLAEALSNPDVARGALDAYEALTGEHLLHRDEIWAVRLSDYGALCPGCAKPFRTPMAKTCAERGYALRDGQVAGPLEPVHHGETRQK